MPVAFSTCPLCEATCGLRITVEDGAVTGIRGDADDVLSHGFVCPKGASLRELHADPDRLRTPLIREPGGSLRPASWDEAFAEIDRRLPAIQAEHGRDAVAAYIGNPSAHNLSSLIYGRVVLKALQTRNLFSASTVDQYPKQMASALMFGSGATVAVPDVDRTDHLLILGANPLASNGSLLTAPDMRGRLRAHPRARRQGRRRRPAAHAHRRARPTSTTSSARGPTRCCSSRSSTRCSTRTSPSRAPLADARRGPRRGPRAGRRHRARRRRGARAASPRREIRRMARELAAAPSAAVYGRIGTTTQRFGTTASWLVDVLNVVTGNLDRPGGAMFPRTATVSSNTAGEPGRGRGAAFGRWHSRVRGLGEVFGELPVACLAEEIETPGDGQVRALLTFAGNPAVSTPNSERLAAALERLDFMVSVDIYVNETTRHADVILPGPSPLQRSHYDLALMGFAVRNVANYSPPVLAPDPDVPAEWETLLRLTGVVTGQGPSADVAAIDRFVALETARRQTADAALARPRPRPRGAAGRGRAPRRARADPRPAAARRALRADAGRPRGGPARDRPRAARAAGARGPAHAQRQDRARARAARRRRRAAARGAGRAGRRRAWSSSGAATCARTTRGCTTCRCSSAASRAAPPTCTPTTPRGSGSSTASRRCVRSRAGAVVVPVEVTDDVMPGVVSIPHGWGHDQPGIDLAVASEHAGTNSNVLTDELAVEPLSGTAILNGIPVELERATAA